MITSSSNPVGAFLWPDDQKVIISRDQKVIISRDQKVIISRPKGSESDPLNAAEGIRK
jgi:hypothetical protein